MDKKYYIDPEELKEQTLSCQALSTCTDLMASMLLTLHDKVLNFPSFRGYLKEDKEDMRSWSIERFLSKGLFTADATKNLFAYFTTGIYRNYQNVLGRKYRKENKRREYVKMLIQQYENDCTIGAVANKQSEWMEEWQ